MIIKDIDYKTILSKLENDGYVKIAYGGIKAKAGTGVGITVLFENPENPNEGPIDYPNLDTLREKKPSDLMIMDLKKGDYQFMTLASVLAKREQLKGKKSELYDTSCRCGD